ncbi:hypothetical protein NM688_g4593 [Phlebia brevispora]|uniref:Uncharacterized protein n=1 Tax=Phlebia brevispora TaxID=194682 RepID=A0ACC1T270_9APHY|nr:hypothetical protein NM688_g4593 [Phlebia brevispora]
MQSASNPSDDMAADLPPITIEDPQGVDTERQQGPELLDPEKLYSRPCDETGTFLDSASLRSHLPPAPDGIPGDWGSFGDRLTFELAEFLFKKEQMPQNNINHLLRLWAASLLPYGAAPPLADFEEMHAVIDGCSHGDAPWSAFTAAYRGPKPPNPPSWMTATYEVWHRNARVCARNMLSNPDFAKEFDTTPYREYDSKLERRYTNLMSGDWSWRQADKYGADSIYHGAMLCPLVLGSDKTTVSVATGQNEYYPLYLSLGNVWNGVRRAHRNAIMVLGFLAIPKGEPKYDVARCPDGYWRRAVYTLGPYIADYIEQVLAANIVQGWCLTCPSHRTHLENMWDGSLRSREHTELLVQAFDARTLWENYGLVDGLIPFTNDFPHADIHELLSGDLLHQIIKGCFKDHLVEWVNEYLVLTHGESEAQEIMDQIDHRIAAAPPFGGLRKFKQGRNFKQWTGDDSKGLMKARDPTLPLCGFVPDDMLRAISTFMEFCYLVRRSVLTDSIIKRIEECIQDYHYYRESFRATGVRPDGFSTLPRQHSVDHYPGHIRNFGAPNGLCSSITESKHITAVKKPWRRSNRYEALGQMLLTNQRLDKLSAARADFANRGMLDGTCYMEVLDTILNGESNRGDLTVPDDGEYADEADSSDDSDTDSEAEDDVVVEGPRVLGDVSLGRTFEPYYPRTVQQLGIYIGVPHFHIYVLQFLYHQLNPDDDATSIPHRLCPPVDSAPVRVVHSARATFYAPSDLSGVGGMRRELIRATPSWRKGPPRYDCIFAEKDPSLPGFRGLHAARVRLFFSFQSQGVSYPCALVQWFTPVGEEPDPLTGMWIVEPDTDVGGSRLYGVIHLDTILRAAHLLPLFGDAILPPNFESSWSLDAFRSYYINKFADHHSHEIAF